MLREMDLWEDLSARDDAIKFAVSDRREARAAALVALRASPASAIGGRAQPRMVFATILKHLPMGDNAKVAFGTGVVLAISYATLARKGVSYENMAEKREAMKKAEAADRAAAREAAGG